LDAAAARKRKQRRLRVLKRLSPAPSVGDDASPASRMRRGLAPPSCLPSHPHTQPRADVTSIHQNPQVNARRESHHRLIRARGGEDVGRRRPDLCQGGADLSGSACSVAVEESRQRRSGVLRGGHHCRPSPGRTLPPPSSCPHLELDNATTTSSSATVRSSSGSASAQGHWQSRAAMREAGGSISLNDCLNTV
jgi:hypothetical protein